jgi:hypothetical protein
MREGSATKFSSTDRTSGPRSEVKPLFLKILAISHCRSRFCPASGIPQIDKFLGMNILGETI